MDTATQNFIPILFKVLFGFVGLNIIVNLVLLYTRRQKINKLLAIYWPVVLLMYVIQGTFQDGNLSVALAYSSGMAASLITALIGFEAIGRKLPIKNYLLFFATLYPLTIWLDSQGYGFTVVAMPFAIATMLPLLHASFCLNILDYQKTTRLQKVLGVVYLFHAIHCINFAVFRMDPGAQLWGWLVSYVLCDLLAILLPSIALETSSLSEKERLEALVLERTNELESSLKTNESLFKVLIHDISSPLMAIKGYAYLMKENREEKGMLLDRMLRAGSAMEDIITQTKMTYLNKKQNKISLAPVRVGDCFKELSYLYERVLHDKKVNLTFNNHLSSDTFVLAEQASLTHSVLSNLLSNGIKFNSPDSNIEITAKEENKNIILEIKDEGPGIPEKVITDVMTNKILTSTEGTNGEKGSGLGLSIVKSFVDSYGGQMEIDSNYERKDSEFGTIIRIKLEKVPESRPLSH